MIAFKKCHRNDVSSIEEMPIVSLLHFSQENSVRKKSINKRISGFIFILSLVFVWQLAALCSTKRIAYQEPLLPKFPLEGRIIFQSNFDGDNEIYLLAKTGLKKLTDNDWEDEYPVWSPDGKSIAFTANPNGNYDIFLMNAEGTGITQLTTASSDEKEPAWFPDGENVVYTREIKKFLRKSLTLLEVNIRTKKSKRVISHYNKPHALSNISPRGNLLTFTGKKTFGWDVALFNMANDEVKFLEDGGKSCRARFSKDGQKLAYVSSKADGKGDIWTMNPDGSEKMRITHLSDTYDYFPSWSPDNKYIVFDSSHQHNHNGDWRLCVVEVQTKKVSFLFDTPGNDIFPDWHR